MARILLACHQFFPRFYTGTEVLVLEAADELVRRGHEVAILTTEPILPGDEVPTEAKVVVDEYQGHQVWRLIVPPTHNPVQRLWTEAYEEGLEELFDGVLEEVQPDLVHGFHLMRLTAAFVDAVERRGVPCFFTATDYWLLCPTYQLIRSDDSLCIGPEAHSCFSCLTALYAKGMPQVPLSFKLATRFPQLAAVANEQAATSQAVLHRRIELHQRLSQQLDGVFLANEFMRKLMHQNGIRSGREYLQEFPLPSRAEGLRKLQPVSSEGVLKVAFIGTLRSSKGPQVLMDACRKIGNAAKIEVQVWGAADDPAFEVDLRARVEGLPWVTFRGTFPQEDFPSVLENIDVVVIPSIWYENTPLTALSALAAKRLLIATNLGGLSGLVEHGENGFLFPPGDADVLAGILRDMAADRASVVKMANQAPSPLNVAQYVDKLIEVYQECTTAFQ